MGLLTSALKRSFSVVKRRLGTLWLATSWPYAGIAICYLATGFVVRAYHDPSVQTDPVTLWNSLSAIAKFGVLIAYIASISLPHGLATAGAVVVVWADLHDEVVGARSVALRIGRILPRLIILSLCIGVMCAFCGIFLVVPGVLAFAFLSFTIPVLMVENTSVWIAMRKGINLASTRLGALLNLYAIVLAVILAAIVALFLLIEPVAAMVPNDIPWWIIPTAWWIAFVPFVSILIMETTAVVVCIYGDVCESQGRTVGEESKP